MGDTNNVIDIISNIPEPLIHEIFSFMDMRSVLQTSVLSSRWRYVWKSSPILTFDFQMFTHRFKKIHCNKNHYIKFIKNIDKGFFAFRPLVRFVNLRSIKLEMNLSPWSVKKLGWLLHISPYIKSLSIVIAPGPGMPRTITPDSEWARVSWLPRNLYHLRSVKIRGILGNISQLKLVELIFKYAVALQEMDLYSWKKSTTEEQLIAFGEKLRTLPIASSKISTFFL
ncbi:hypothetical protein C5167_012611 [Papaver somniferum]|uniref:F-box domain-containing protein n=1 Tax=Papaver somniferum TaxID=3469 RepID=A0A4Y7IXY4_PAPSO|nr:hypothetical protein C5167_012611 [Papaver somniferum]